MRGRVVASRFGFAGAACAGSPRPGAGRAPAGIPAPEAEFFATMRAEHDADAPESEFFRPTIGAVSARLVKNGRAGSGPLAGYGHLTDLFRRGESGQFRNCRICQIDELHRDIIDLN